MNQKQPNEAADPPAAERAGTPGEQHKVNEQAQEQAAEERESDRGYQ